MNANKNIWIKRLFSSALHDPLNTLSPNKWEERARPTPPGILVVITINDEGRQQQQQNETRDSTAWRIINIARVGGWRGATERREKDERSLMDCLFPLSFPSRKNSQPAIQGGSHRVPIPLVPPPSPMPPSPSLLHRQSELARSVCVINTSHEDDANQQNVTHRVVFSSTCSSSTPPNKEANSCGKVGN